MWSTGINHITLEPHTITLNFGCPQVKLMVIAVYWGVTIKSQSWFLCNFQFQLLLQNLLVDASAQRASHLPPLGQHCRPFQCINIKGNTFQPHTVKTPAKHLPGSCVETLSSWWNSVVHPMCAFCLGSFTVLKMSKQTNLPGGLEGFRNITRGRGAPGTVSRAVRASVNGTNTHK